MPPSVDDTTPKKTQTTGTDKKAKQQPPKPQKKKPTIAKKPTKPTQKPKCNAVSLTGKYMTNEQEIPVGLQFWHYASSGNRYFKNNKPQFQYWKGEKTKEDAQWVKKGSWIWHKAKDADVAQFPGTNWWSFTFDLAGNTHTLLQHLKAQTYQVKVNCKTCNRLFIPGRLGFHNKYLPQKPKTARDVNDLCAKKP